MEHEYLFDFDLSASLRVKAADKATALAMLKNALCGASVNAGAWPNGDPILFEASYNGEGITLVERDGVDIDEPAE